MVGSPYRDILKEIEPIVRIGGAVHWLHAKQKRPIEADWANKPRATLATLQRSYREGYNVGLRLGEPSEIDGAYLHAIDVDIRIPEAWGAAMDALEELFPDYRLTDFPMVASGSGGYSRHLYFLTSKPFHSKKLAHSDEKFTDDAGKTHWEWEIELFGTGKQVVLPPSVHPDTGKRYKWLKKLDFDAIELGGSAYIIEVEAIERALEDDGGEYEHRGEKTGMPLEEAEEHLMVLPEEWYDDRERWLRAGMALHHEYDGSVEAFRLWNKFSRQSKKFDLAYSKKRWRGFKDDTANPVSMRTIRMAAEHARVLNGFDDCSDEPEEADKPDDTETGTTEPDSADPDAPDLSIIYRTQTPAPALPLEVFGDVWAEQLQKWAINSGAPVDYVASALLTGAASVIGNTRRLRINEGWVEGIALWMKNIGSPSTNKTPAFGPVMQCLDEVENYWNRGFSDRVKEWKDAKKIAATHRKKWEREIEAIVAQGGEETRMPSQAEEPPVPKRKRLRLMSATIESMLEILAANPRGILYFRDELSGWYQDMGRYSNSTDRPFWLQAYDGKAFTVDRVKLNGEPMLIPYLTASVLGAIQPDKLTEILESADDGLAARFLPVWPEHKPAVLTCGVKEGDVAQLAFDELANLNMVENEEGKMVPKVISLSPEAFNMFQQWLNAREQNDGSPVGKLENAYAKAGGHVARLAIVLEHLYYAAEPFTGCVPEEVGVRAMRAAIRLREEYFRPMQERTFGMYSMGDADKRSYALASYIASKRPASINATQIRRSFVIPGINQDAAKVDAAIAELIERKWLMPHKGNTRKTGRKPKDFTVNPILYDLLRKRNK